MKRDDKMHMAVLLHATGFHVASWLHPSVPLERSADIAYWAELARIAEAAKFDVAFLADNGSVAYQSNPNAQRRISLAQHLEPMTLLSGLAPLTERIGLVGSFSTSYVQPYLVARQFASLDHISNGRAGWNVVTSSDPNEASNYGLVEAREHADRYKRAEEYLKIVQGLWLSWDADAFPLDRENSIYLHPEKMHALDYKSEGFSVRGPLNIARSPQGKPVVFQAGSSGPGIELGAATADGIFTAQQSLSDAKEFWRTAKQKAEAFGRRPENLRIFCGIIPFVGRTLQEAQDKFDYIQSLIHPDVGLQILYELTGGFDFSRFPLDGPVPELPPSNATKSRLELLQKLAKGKQLTIRQALFAGSCRTGAPHDHRYPGINS
ncbi:NtaA/DmoA family FMN-dependent monooxygenase [Bradyrhizobium diazoefficiens]|uniref:NtaA/DmoA family FMN-dependent monooxygenase n=1 Tax=Bradyrhizobium diazoefficiens TaxID=1355477 RepID=UPI0035114B24